MSESIRENIDKIIPFIQERFGELTSDELSRVRETPERLSLLIEEKFGVPKSTVEDEIGQFLRNNIVGDIADKAKGLLGGLNR